MLATEGEEEQEYIVLSTQEFNNTAGDAEIASNNTSNNHNS